MLMGDNASGRAIILRLITLHFVGGSDLRWTPLFIDTYLTMCILNSDLCEMFFSSVGPLVVCLCRRKHLAGYVLCTGFVTRRWRCG
jgi:hypothetical protein